MAIFLFFCPHLKSLIADLLQKKTLNPLKHNYFPLNGIQEVSGSIPLISTKEVRRAFQKLRELAY